MTKYILDGGGIRNAADGGRALFGELVAGLGSQPRILLCYFAQPDDVWHDRYQEWTGRIAAAVGPEVSPLFGMATHVEFEAQSRDYDALFIYGGDNEILRASLLRRADYRTPLSNFRTVQGSSAGAIMLSEAAWSCDERNIVTGLGLVPAKILVHYESPSYAADDPRGVIDWQAAYHELEQFGDPGLPVHALREVEYVVFNT